VAGSTAEALVARPFPDEGIFNDPGGSFAAPQLEKGIPPMRNQTLEHNTPVVGKTGNPVVPSFMFAFLLICVILSFGSRQACALEGPQTLRLEEVVNGRGWKINNRSSSMVETKGRIGLQFDAREGDGMACLDGFEFSNGVIELDILGRSQPVQGSFVGVAFRVQDAKNYDAVYFRPFNFRSDDPLRRSHSVQYISQPAFNWPKLRQERPGQFEKSINPAPDGDKWFHVRIIIAKPKITVYVNEAAEPCLTVDELSDRTGGSIGLWVGNGSSGTFANLKITPQK
jgi:hypothetical protein